MTSETIDSRVSRLEGAYEHLATKADLEKLRADLKDDIASVKDDIANLGSSLKTLLIQVMLGLFTLQLVGLGAVAAIVRALD